jgi:UDP-N-acetylglucosamine 3-dehydrogenase
MKIGILGTGFGKYHAQCYKSIPEVDIAGIAGRNREKTEQTAKELEVKAFFDMTELITHPEVDLIDVCLPTTVHEEYVIKALHSGKHVFCETPISYSLKEAENIFKAAKIHKRNVFVGLFNRFISEYKHAQQHMNSHTSGPIRSIFCNRRTPPIWGNLTENIILDFMIHDIDYVYWLLGHPLRVSAKGVECKQGGWESVFINLTYADKVAVIEGCAIMPLSAPFQTGLRIICQKAAMDIEWCMKGDIPESKITFYPEQGTPQPVSIQGHDPYRAECVHVLQCFKSGTPSPVIDIEHAYQSLKVALAAKESLDRSCEVTL